jgi:TIR domain
MSVPVHRRNYDAFLSHAHVDHDFVEELYRWLGEVAGLNVWYDAKQMSGGDPIGGGLQKAIEDCRGVLLIASPEAIVRGWVQAEIEIARVEQGDSKDFRIIPVRLGNADVAGLIKGVSWIDVKDSKKLGPDVAAALLRAFYPGEHRPDPRTSRDVYVSGSWQASDNASALAVCRALEKQGLRMIGDAKDQKGFKSNRIQSLIESCGAFIGVIPYRDATTSASADVKPYKYFLTELDAAIAAQLPIVVVADPRIRRTDGDDTGWFRMETSSSACPPDVATAIGDLWNRWIDPPNPHEIFLATDLSSPSAERDGPLRRLVERITGMRTIVGNEIREPDLQTAIMRAIERAFLVIADISSPEDDNFNVDVCIEAAIAMAAGTNLALMARGRPRSPPFMLRRAGQLTSYADEVEHLGAVHSIVREYRRRIVNAEIEAATTPV